MKIWLVPFNGLFEIEAETFEEADAAWEDAFSGLANHGTVSWRGPMTEAEYEAQEIRQ